MADNDTTDLVSRRRMLVRLGLTSAAAYTIPSLTTLSMAQAGSSPSSGGDSGGASSGGDSSGPSSSSDDSSGPSSSDDNSGPSSSDDSSGPSSSDDNSGPSSSDDNSGPSTPSTTSNSSSSRAREPGAEYVGDRPLRPGECVVNATGRIKKC